MAKRKRPVYPDMRCEVCGCQTPRRHNRQKYCVECSKKVITAAERARLKRAIKATNCITCNIVVQFRYARPKFCPACKVEDKRARDRVNQKIYRQSEKAKQRERERSAIRNKTPEVREYRREYEKSRKDADPKFALGFRMRTLIRDSLRRQKGGASWVEMVDFTVAQLKDHIERQFLPGMSWANRKKWHIDHIRPVASFNYDGPEHPDFKACWSLTNLRPMWAKANQSKGAKQVYLI